jgi:hypothetical protein
VLTAADQTIQRRNVLKLTKSGCLASKFEKGRELIVLQDYAN